MKLTQPLMSNIGEEAIPANTLLSAEIQGVDSSGRVTAVVTAILKDGTEYTLRPGTIVIQGKGGEPLIANQYRDKGKEILTRISHKRKKTFIKSEKKKIYLIHK